VSGALLYVGIDPGVTGGIAIIDHLGLAIRAIKMPETRQGVLEALELPPSAQVRAVLEKVNAGVFGHGKVGKMGVVSAFTFGGQCERVAMALHVTRIPFDQVLPAAWQGALGCRSGGDKNITKRRAIELFPTVKVTHAIADALLLAEYCRRCYLRVGHPQGAEHGEAVKGAGEGRQGSSGRDSAQAGDAQGRRVEVERRGAIAVCTVSKEAAAGTDPAGDGAGSKRAPRSSVRGHRGRSETDEQGQAR
jgi:hypothetical protein